ncbi:hypothetical protein DAMDJJ_31850 [Cupriavidus necator]|uniref:tetratricopeptide repeat protein n=1 Tax=Cupriavidus necator TaxID=106590 RepID=UPI003F741E4F
MKKAASLITFLALAGCATKWHNPALTDSASMERQLKIDDGYCTMVAAGAAPMPAPVQPTATTSSVNITGSTFNPATGTTTTSNYRGQVNTSPAGGFAGGFASGMANGAAIGAALAQDKIHKSCMYAKGWYDTPPPASTASSPPTSKVQPTLRQSPRPVSATPIYTSPKEEWGADTDEFLSIYPEYRTPALFDQLNDQVKRIATASPHLSGPAILIAAREAVAQAGVGPAALPKSTLAQMTYPGAVAGKPVDQAAMGVFYIKGDDAVPANIRRSAYWTQKAASAGNPIGQMGYGALLFEGKGLPRDRVEAYRWVQPLATTDETAKELLRMFEAQMTAGELSQVR